MFAPARFAGVSINLETAELLKGQKDKVHQSPKDKGPVSTVPYTGAESYNEKVENMPSPRFYSAAA